MSELFGFLEISLITGEKIPNVWCDLDVKTPKGFLALIDPEKEGQTLFVKEDSIISYVLDNSNL